MATKNTIPACISERKQETAVAANQTRAEANCIFHLRRMLEVALAAPSMAPTMATATCRLSRPLMPSESMAMKMEIPMPAQIAIMARPKVVSGCLLALREASTNVSTLAAIMVTGQAIMLWPKADHAMAT